MPTFKFKIENRKFTALNPKWHDWKDNVNDGIYICEWRKERKSGSNNQNRYYWGVIIPHVMDYMGDDDKDYIHDILKEKFAQREKNDILGIDTAKGYSRMNSVERENYHEKIRRFFLTEYKCQIPLPNEVIDDKIYETN